MLKYILIIMASLMSTIYTMGDIYVPIIYEKSLLWEYKDPLAGLLTGHYVSYYHIYDVTNKGTIVALYEHDDNNKYFVPCLAVCIQGDYFSIKFKPFADLIANRQTLVDVGKDENLAQKWLSIISSHNKF